MVESYIPDIIDGLVSGNLNPGAKALECVKQRRQHTCQTIILLGGREVRLKKARVKCK